MTAGFAYSALIDVERIAAQEIDPRIVAALRGMVGFKAALTADMINGLLPLQLRGPFLSWRNRRAADVAQVVEYVDLHGRAVLTKLRDAVTLQQPRAVGSANGAAIGFLHSIASALPQNDPIAAAAARGMDDVAEEASGLDKTHALIGVVETILYFRDRPTDHGAMTAMRHLHCRGAAIVERMRAPHADSDPDEARELVAHAVSFLAGVLAMLPGQDNAAFVARIGLSNLDEPSAPLARLQAMIWTFDRLLKLGGAAEPAAPSRKAAGRCCLDMAAGLPPAHLPRGWLDDVTTSPGTTPLYY